MASLSSDERKRFLRALEEDAEFRYAVAGKLGLLEILKRLDCIEEELRKLWVKSLEHDKRFEEISKRFEVIEKKLLEHDERFNQIQRDTSMLRAQVGGFTSRAGIGIERLILEVYRDLLKRRGIHAEKVEKISIKDIDGRWLRKGARIELDIYVHNREVWFIEVKSLVELNDVEWFQTRCEIMEKVLGKKPTRKLIITIDIFREALERARELGIDVIYTNVHEVNK